MYGMAVGINADEVALRGRALEPLPAYAHGPRVGGVCEFLLVLFDAVSHRPFRREWNDGDVGQVVAADNDGDGVDGGGVHFSFC